MRSILATSLLLFLVVLFSAAAALKESDFRNSCSSAAFCRRQRQSPSLPRNFYFVDQTSVESRGTEFSFTLVNRRSTRPLSAVLTTLDGRSGPSTLPVFVASKSLLSLLHNFPPPPSPPSSSAFAFAPLKLHTLPPILKASRPPRTGMLLQMANGSL
jgi:hypothetical protein